MAIYLLKGLAKTKERGLPIFVAVLVGFLVYMLVESDVFLFYNIQGFVFWWLLGLSGWLIEHGKKQEKVSNT